MALLNNVSVSHGKILALAAIVAVGPAITMLWLGNNALSSASQVKPAGTGLLPGAGSRFHTANAQQLERIWPGTFSTAVTIGELDALANSDTLLASMQEAFPGAARQAAGSSAHHRCADGQDQPLPRRSQGAGQRLIDGSVPIEQIQAVTAVSSELETLKKGDLAAFLNDSESAFTSLVA